jgi:hypothetical protein
VGVLLPLRSVVAQELPEPPNTEAARSERDTLTVEPPHSMAGYSREKFPHWVTITGRYDTRGGSAPGRPRGSQ